MQYSRDVSASPSGASVLDTPLSRGMTADVRPEPPYSAGLVADGAVDEVVAAFFSTIRTATMAPS
ncbi:hypothetical protein C7G43_04125 [Bradyrhizobium sp. MOS004]|nr:hypothetical protein C7G43_04125 [Bradyrhizobium sp. MOS004]HAQ84480.1 hypothetical protein [Bradyrhizobium sp.]HAR16713.1 hypothetical protein [Bradyrhizobium sp.]HAR28288.1 hypothetical protein [Bradyrhizobium sp.]HBY29959.1 hypothetical protein [Bradyrhizobium sp.]